MNAGVRLDQYLEQLRLRLRREIYARATAAVVLTALAITAVAVWLLTRAGFPAPAVLGTRLGLVLAVVAIALLTVWRPLRRLRIEDGAREFERHLPDQGGRIETWLDGKRRLAAGEASPLLELLAEDAATVADRHPLVEVLPRKRLLIPGAMAAAGVLALLGLLFLGTAYWGPGARHLWFGQSLPAATLAAASSIAVTPGDVAVRRNQDLAIAAAVTGSRPGAATLHVRYGEDGKWEESPMQHDADGKFAYTLYALREPATYYVSAGNLRSKQHIARVVEPPRVENIKLTYLYPSWTGLPQRIEEAGGDVRAVAGTRVKVEVAVDAPLDAPQLVVNEASIDIDQSGLVGTGTFVIKDPGQYRVSARVGDELVALTEDYRISVVEDEQPTVAINKPGRDYQASSIEEVPVKVSAQDDFRLESLELRYAVNGGDWKTEKLNAAASDINAAALLRLEELQQPGSGPSGAARLVPGDLVSYYAVARDHKHEVQTDLFLIQVQPFDRRYTQSQAGGGGGGGGGGGDDAAISQRQREVLLATFNLTRVQEKGQRDAERLADNARMLSDVQKTLADQAKTLVERARARLLDGADANISSFVASLEQAAKAMEPAAEKLAKVDLQKAISDEQRALQYLLRAEATFRDIQVAMQNNAGGGGGGAQAGRDVAEMTELEMDLEKNQYETESQSASAAAGADAENELVRRLKELARRQEQLARQNAQRNATPEAQRWQQEQLKREAEELRRQLEQLAKREEDSKRQQEQQGEQGQQGQQSQSQQARTQQNGSQQERSQQGRSQQGGNQSGNSQQEGDSAASQAMQQVQEAIKNMQAGNQGQNASRDLRDAIERLEQGQRQGVSDRFENLAAQARELLNEQRRSEEDLQTALRKVTPPQLAREGARTGMDYATADKLAERKRELQAQLEALQSKMQAARQQNKVRAPDASKRVAEAGAELQESETAARLARSAMELERGRAAQAATRDGIITESLESLQQGLDEAARVAAREAKAGEKGEPAQADELLAELGELRRAVDEAQRDAARRDQGANQSGNQNGPRQANSQQPGGQPGGQQGGGQQAGAASEGGDSQGGDSQGGGNAGGGNRAGGLVAGGRAAGGLNGGWDGVNRIDPRLAMRGGLRPQAQASGQRLQALRNRLEPGALTEQDVARLKELTDRLRRAGDDPMASEYERMQVLVSQLEL
ncbi:MAG: hypothetical protein ABI859_09200, partial [Pseudomonadota bacterium]